jgi:RNA ligase (TIGR02306 family)
MSEITCEIFEIKEMEKHPDADSLSIVKVYEYPVIVRTDDWKVGDRAVYFPVEACLPNIEPLQFIWRSVANPTEKARTVRAMRLRGIFSMGVLVPARAFIDYYNEQAMGLKVLPLHDAEPGTNVAELLGVTKYDPPEPVDMGGHVPSRRSADPEWFKKYTNIQNIRKYARCFEDGEEVVVTEKIHGTNARFVLHDEQLHVGSHNLMRTLDNTNIWAETARKYDMEEKLRSLSRKFGCCKMIFGEIYGGSVQKGYSYDRKDPGLVVFDVLDFTTGKYMDYDQFGDVVYELGLQAVPEIHRGPWSGFEDIKCHAEGDTILGNRKHLREGMVVRTVKERWDRRSGRVVLKLHGEKFLLKNK